MTTGTFQQTFTTQIANITQEAYNQGLLQYHPMVIADITITMTMFANFNQLAFQYNNHLVSITMYDEESEDTQLHSINDTLVYITRL